jgi:choline dehydrogenase-like flavoprotein
MNATWRPCFGGVKWIKRILESPMLHDGPPVPLFNEPLETDEDLRQFIRHHADTSYHPVGTCRMGSDRLAVVDARLRVHGVHGLRIVDCSVMPTVPGGNTNAPAVMVAEKRWNSSARICAPPRLNSMN